MKGQEEEQLKEIKGQGKKSIKSNDRLKIG